MTTTKGGAFPSYTKELEANFHHILKGCRNNKRTSQNQLYKLYYSYGMSICFRYVNDKEEAQFIFNNAFLKIFENIHKYDHKLDFKPWFKTRMANTAINHIKKMNKFKVETSNDSIANIPTKEDILSKLSFDELVATIQSLSVSYRTVFNMYVLDGFKYEEIAKKTWNFYWYI